MQDVYKHDFYEKVPMQQCWRVTGKDPIGNRGVDINNGGQQNHEYRQRLVAQGIKQNKREALCVATPPLEAKHKLLCFAVTEGTGYNSKAGMYMNLDFINDRRATVHAMARRSLYVKLPPEDNEEGMGGRLNKAMNGTRDAAQNWATQYIQFMTDTGIRTG